MSNTESISILSLKKYFAKKKDIYHECMMDALHRKDQDNFMGFQNRRNWAEEILRTLNAENPEKNLLEDVQYW